ncbi:hypothetical protein IWW48_003473 [Coemansia sp. RSA 1200]|nr:hypothetical protein IWW48_003473 [Coemansia sp. RSA 1200]
MVARDEDEEGVALVAGCGNATMMLKMMIGDAAAAMAVAMADLDVDVWIAVTAAAFGDGNIDRLVAETAGAVETAAAGVPEANEVLSVGAPWVR